MRLSLVIPCFNEASNLQSVLQDVAQWKKSTGTEGEVIVVNDGSTDDSAALLTKLQAEYEWLTVVEHAANKGYGVAVRSGLDAATCEVIGFMDGDGQFHAQDLSTLLAAVGDVSFVAGRRRRRADPLIRSLFGKVLGLTVWGVFGLWVRDVNCGLKVFRKDIWQRIRPVYGVEKLFNTELYLRLRREKIRWKQIDVPHYPRRSGTPTGGSLRVIARMFREIADLKAGLRRG